MGCACSVECSVLLGKSMLPIDPARPKVLADSVLSGEESLALPLRLNSFFRLIFKLIAV